MLQKLSSKVGIPIKKSALSNGNTMKIFLISILLLQGTLICTPKVHKKTAVEQWIETKQKLVAFLFCLKCLRKDNNCYNLPLELKIKIISYVPSLIHSHQLLKTALAFKETKDIPFFIKELPSYIMEEFLKNNIDTNKDINIHIQHELDERKKTSLQEPEILSECTLPLKYPEPSIAGWDIPYEYDWGWESF